MRRWRRSYLGAPEYKGLRRQGGSLQGGDCGADAITQETYRKRDSRKESYERVKSAHNCNKMDG